MTWSKIHKDFRQFALPISLIKIVATMHAVLGLFPT